MHTFWIACSLERYSLVSFCFFFPGGGGYLFICWIKCLPIESIGAVWHAQNGASVGDNTAIF